ncbi:hypothetical protein [Lacticaseibacillus jixiensis]|uniref:hypothetical protein n=1 Tax=Lacticaseibacillus jixiensis TaxID=3231926 RepID=UPI0036F32965
MKIEEFSNVPVKIMDLIYRSKTWHGNFTPLSQVFRSQPKTPGTVVWGFILELDADNWLSIGPYAWSDGRGGYDTETGENSEPMISTTPKGYTFEKRYRAFKRNQRIKSFWAPLATAIIVAIFTVLMAA